MEELSKKDILTLIGENITSVRHSGYKGFDEGVELEEMPQKPEDYPKFGAPDPTKPTKRSKGVVPTWTRLYETDEEGKIIDHVGWYRYDEETQKATPIIFTCEWDELVAKHPDLVGKLKDKFGDVNLIEEDCPAFEPGRKKGNLVIKPIPGDDGEVVSIEGNPYLGNIDDEGNVKTIYTREKINRSFNTILKDKLQSQEAVDAMKKLSLPKIIIDNSKHRNQRSDVNNETIRFESHNVNLYETQDEFRQHVMGAIRTRDVEEIPDKGDKHLRRVYNTEYRNWDKTRFTNAAGYGKTPVFKLDSGDFPNEQTFEVMVSSDVKVIGKAIEKNENDEVTKWNWEISYLAEYAKKAPGDRVARKRNKDLEIVKNVTVELSEPKKFDGETELNSQGGIISGDRGGNHPLTDVNITAGLEQVLDEFVNEIKNTNPASAVRKAIVSIADVGGQRQPQFGLNEDKVRELVKKVIKENK
jgi:hypothetical protein